MNTVITEEQRVERAHLAIMRHPKFCAWAGLLYIGNWKVDDKMPTAAVDLRGNVFYGRQFIKGIDKPTHVDTKMNFVVLHEQGHKALMHLTRGKAMFLENPGIANAAADEVVNNMIYEIDPQEQFAAMHYDNQGKPLFFRNPKYKGWSMKEVYNDLMKSATKINVKMIFDGHDTSGSEGKKLSPEEQAAVEQAIDNALRSGKYLAGKNGANVDRMFGDILAPKINWRECLAEFILEMCQGEDSATWRKPMRRFVGMDWYLPSFYTEEIGELVVAVDTSGSIGGAEMNAFLSEIMEMCRVTPPKRLRLIYWSDGIAGEEVYEGCYDSLPAVTKPVGGGGTCVYPVADRVRELENIQCAVILTDGHIPGSWGEWGDVPTLWCITSNEMSPTGRSLKLEL